ncbi:uncharacterized protein METZ01_LOCUS478264, partial [marine metagenome]
MRNNRNLIFQSEQVSLQSLLLVPQHPRRAVSESA